LEEYIKELEKVGFKIIRIIEEDYVIILAKHP